MPHPGGIFLRLASCVRCEGGSVADMWCCDARSTQRVWANASTLMAAEYALLPHREGGAYCQSSRESYTDRSQQLSQAATPRTWLGSFVSQDVRNWITCCLAVSFWS